MGKGPRPSPLHLSKSLVGILKRPEPPPPSFLGNWLAHTHSSTRKQTPHGTLLGLGDDWPQGHPQRASASASTSTHLFPLQLTNPQKKKKIIITGNRQLGRATRRVRQRTQKQSQQRLGNRRRRNSLRRKARPTDLYLPRLTSHLERAQSPSWRRASRRDRSQQETRSKAGRTLDTLRRQRGGVAQ